MICTTDPDFIKNLAKDIIDGKASSYFLTSRKAGNNTFFKLLDQEITKQIRERYHITDLTLEEGLVNIIRNFIKDNEITSPEVLHQTNVKLNTLELIQTLCSIVGYYERK